MLLLAERAEVSSAHVVCTSSLMEEASQRRRISSTRREGPETTFASDPVHGTERIERNSAPPRTSLPASAEAEVLDDELAPAFSKYGEVTMTRPPKVRSSPFRVPPR